jgi:hypothetical protein
MTKRSLALIAAIGLSLGVAACETATPYQPLERGSRIAGGFTDERLDADHFRVSFKGNTLTSRRTVETYLLYRAAELTLGQGYDWFETVDHHTDRDQRTYIDPDPFYGPGYAWGYFRPYWSYYSPAYGWRGWGPFWGDPFWGDTAVVQTVQQFEATAVIALHHGPKPPGLARALDARQVIENLGPQIQRPKPGG